MGKEKTRQKKELGFFSVVALVVGLQLGSAMFLLPHQLAPYGIWALISWAIAGTGALALCRVFAALAHHSSRMGGPHVYVDEAFGKRAAFYVGWSYWIISWLSSVPVLLLVISSLEHLIGDLGNMGRLCTEAVILISIMMINLRGAALAGVGEIIFSTLKSLPMIIIPLLSFSYWNTDYLFAPSSHPPLFSLNAASLLTFWGFIGLEAGTTIANYVKNSAVVVPKALFWGTSLVIFIYVFNTIAVMSTIPPDILKSSTNTYSVLLEIIGGTWSGKIVSLLVVVMCLGTLNSWLLASGQIAMVAAREGLFPVFLGKTNKYQSPGIAVAFTAIALFLCMILLQNKTIHEQLNQLINLSTSIFIMIYMIVAVALVKFIIHKKIPSSAAVWTAACISLLFCFWSVATTEPKILISSLIIPFMGFVLSFVFKWPVR